jgi:hypothetical protein
MFSKKKLPDLTNEAYERWLRAQRPPFDWFLALSEVEQEQMALMGDAHMQDLAIALGYAIRDPETADAGMSAMQGDASAEATLATKIAQGFASKLADMQRTEEAAQARTRRSAPSMSGFGDRRSFDEQRPPQPSLWNVEGQKA